jgi:hypothetical protein
MSYSILTSEEKRLYILYLDYIFSVYLNISVTDFRILLLRTTKYFDVNPIVFIYASTLNEIYGSQNVTIFDLINKVTDVFFADNMENKNLFFDNIEKLFNINIDLNNIDIDFIKDNINENIKNELINLFSLLT